jgi:hypothetical protein
VFEPKDKAGGDALDAKLARADAGLGDAAPVTGPGTVTAGASQVTELTAPIVDESQLWIDAALHYGDVARQLVPDRAKPHWTDDRLRRVGAALARCAKFYNWKFGAMVNHPLAMLATAALPLAWPIVEPYALPYLKGGADPGADPLAKTDDGGSAPPGPGEQLH